MINSLNVRFDMPSESMDMLEGNIVITDCPSKDREYTYPFSMDCVCTVVVKSGGLKCLVDLEQIEVNRTGLLIIFPTQVVENLVFTEDFKGSIVLFSRQFMDSMAVSDKFDRFMSIKSSPFSPIEGESLGALLNYVEMIRGTIRQKDHPYREDVVRLLTKAFCLGLGYYIHPSIQNAKNTGRAEEISSSFIELIKQHCITQRNLAFYADKLCISIKHLSAMLYSSTGKAPSKWIEDYTILKAKQLLSTTNYSMVMISEMMEFKSPSDFGKYFKKHTGMTPLAFRASQQNQGS